MQIEQTIKSIGKVFLGELSYSTEDLSVGC